jgi:hypothetical protein
MKIAKTIGWVVVVTLLVSLAYWIGYQHGSTPTRTRIAAANSLRQVRLGFREGHNDISRFIATGDVAAPKPQTKE